MIRICAMANCKTTNTLRNEMPPTIFDVILLFKAVIGVKPDKIMAGYIPENNVTIMMTSTMNKIRIGLEIKFIVIFVSSNLLRKGRVASATQAAIIVAAIVIK